MQQSHPEVKVFDGGTAVGYVRVSRCGTDDQTSVLAQERSIAAQKQAITGYAETHGMQIVAWHVDVGQGRDLPGLGQLMRDVGSPGRGFDTVLVYRRSRLSRNGVNQVQTMLELREAGVTVVSVTGAGYPQRRPCPPARDGIRGGRHRVECPAL